MGAKLGDAGQARELAKLFETWRRAVDRQDAETMAAVKRAISALAEGRKGGARDDRLRSRRDLAGGGSA
ncbi:hypothetical protein ACVIHH_000254 [Bradyrhizobium sp. USDA 4518]